MGSSIGVPPPVISKLPTAMDDHGRLGTPDAQHVDHLFELCPIRPSNSSTKTPSTGTSGLTSPSPPAAEALREHHLDPEAVSWLQTNFLKIELELGHCLRTPAEEPCECDLVLTCSKFLTTSDYSPRLRARLDVETATHRRRHRPRLAA